MLNRIKRFISIRLFQIYWRKIGCIKFKYTDRPGQASAG